jgi:O-antigen/teichoic acid export membrane protein
MDLKKLTRGLFGGSILFLIAFNIFNALNYFFHFFMARYLSAADYGVLAALMSIVFIFSIPSETIQLISSKFASTEKSDGNMKHFLFVYLKKGFFASLAVLAAYLVLAILLSKVLSINYLLLAITGLLFPVFFTIPITRGILQGQERFGALGFNLIFEGIAKIALSVLFVFIGLKTYGAIAGVAFGILFAFALSFIPLRKIFSAKEAPSRFKLTYGYGTSVLIAIFMVYIFFSLDIIVAKAVFSAEYAGYYAIASMMAKVIFFATLPISKVMFPYLSSSSRDKKKRDRMYLYSILILAFCIFVALAGIFLFHDLIIRIFAGRLIPQSSSILLFVGIAFSLLSFTNLVLFQRLSLGRTRNCLWLFVFPLIEVILLYFFRHSLLEYSVALIAASAIFLWGSVVLIGRRFS